MTINLFIEGLNEDSQMIFEIFTSSYKETAIRTYKTAFNRIYEHTKKSSIKDLTIEDYRSLCNKEVSPCVRQIFKYLYANDYLENSRDFELEFGNKLNLKKRYDKKKAESKEIYRPAISAQDLDKIIKFVEKVNPEDIDDSRLAFCFYILFVTAQA